MSRTFLTPDELAKFREDYRPPAFPLDGKPRARLEWPSARFSEMLRLHLVESWSRDTDFEKAGPILVGSAARDELCPRSDLDVLFVGDEAAVAAFVRRQQEKGVRIRSRVPEDPEDWTVGVEIPDILALLEARALTEGAAAKLERQRTKLETRRGKERRAWLGHLLKERAEREARFDSIANVLEPNLKYGPGGLRDLDQARQILRLYPERFEAASHARELFETYAGFWTMLRQKLHLEGQGDLLSGPAQFDIARWSGMPHREFMRQVQRGLSRVHFYATWVFERARAAPGSKARAPSLKPLESRQEALDLLKKDPSVLARQRVREDIDRLFPAEWKTKPTKERGKLLWQVLTPEADEKFVRAVFDSRLIDKLCPEIKPLIGLVQHDQYHRYTADVHLQQACLEWRRTLKKPGRLGALSAEARELKPADKVVLSWTVLYHDLMKGRDGDHSDLGRALVRKELGAFGVAAATIAEVEWLVEHHLELSQAAFRRNPMSPSTWARLEEIGAVGDRLRRLAVFTAVDILATNSEAWTPWKSRLLADLLHALRSPRAHEYSRLRRELARAKAKIDVEAVDGFILSKLPAKTLAADLAAAESAKVPLAPLVVARAGHGVWIRFHEKADRPGLFAAYTQRLYSLGLRIRHASVQTLPSVGVYDWFEVAGRRTPAQIRTWLEKSAEQPSKPPPAVKFDSVTLVSQDESEWVLSFKGPDQPGLLVAAAAALAAEGMSIKSARVHTWGRQIDDLFHVEPKGEANELLKRLRARFGVS